MGTCLPPAMAVPSDGSPSAALPPEVEAALKRARVPPQALAAVVAELPTAGPALPRLAWNADQPVNPASLFKLITTYAALDMLGPAYSWTTPVWVQGSVRDGVLDGNVVIKGSGDPQLKLERVWLLLRRLQQAGVRDIHGDIVLDRSAFAASDGNAADFDGEAHRTYNVRPDALLLNYKSAIYTFRPDPARRVANVMVEPALSGVLVDKTVPLLPGPCDDWVSALKAQLNDPDRVRLTGGYLASCGEKAWPLAYADPASYNARLLMQLWREMGGKLEGSVREGAAPAGVAPSFELKSPPLAETVRDINKYSNNVMAEQLFLTLALGSQPVRAEDARLRLTRWIAQRWGDAAAADAVIDNGSGLSRSTRVSALLLARVLDTAWHSPVMPELIASLPVSGLDGTLRRSTAPAGRAHLKTGSLRDVAGIAGYVLSASGRRYLLVAIVNHPDANATRAALDALVAWTFRDTETGTPDVPPSERKAGAER